MVASQETIKELTAYVWKHRRLILFVMIVYVGKQCKDKACKEE